MSWEYSENILVQNSAGNVLETRLGWDVVFAYNTEVLGESGTLGRKTYHDIVLTRYLKKALFENNDWMTEEYCTAAIKSLCAYTASATLMQINEEKYGLLRDGIRDLLWAELPESYDDVAIADYRQQIYEYVYNAYPAA